MKTAHREFLRFCVVGSIGFCVDVWVTLMLTQGADLGTLPARIGAFLVAATATWLLNRGYTFRSARGTGSWPAYVALTAIGSGINLAAYLGWLHWAGTSGPHIFAGVAIGSVTAMAFNFLVSKHIVFKAPA